mmetsp:Transcript_41491/g.131974  ORF Transcript_41491/g.131974 Transcript_41491/m.131974 type:complete len:225 (-) Transcript_41491:389-1063(-)
MRGRAWQHWRGHALAWRRLLRCVAREHRWLGGAAQRGARVPPPLAPGGPGQPLHVPALPPGRLGPEPQPGWRRGRLGVEGREHPGPDVRRGARPGRHGALPPAPGPAGRGLRLHAPDHVRGGHPRGHRDQAHAARRWGAWEAPLARRRLCGLRHAWRHDDGRQLARLGAGEHVPAGVPRGHHRHVPVDLHKERASARGWHPCRCLRGPPGRVHSSPGLRDHLHH